MIYETITKVAKTPSESAPGDEPATSPPVEVVELSNSLSVAHSTNSFISGSFDGQTHMPISEEFCRAHWGAIGS